MRRRDPTASQAACVAEQVGTSHDIIPPASSFRHAALLYRDEDDYSGGVTAVLRAATTAAAPVHAALCRDVPRQVRGATPSLFRANMAELGRNPARIIPAGLSFADDHPGAAGVYFLWEPAWPGRSAAEFTEVARHETLCNLAFSGRAVSILCLYDAARLDEHTLRIAEHTHPVVISGGQPRASHDYLGSGCFPPGSDDPLTGPAPGAECLAYNRRLGAVRDFAARHARAAGLHPERASDFVLAVSEVASNTLGHTRGGGVIHAWSTARELLCQIADHGHIAAPLAGRRRQRPEAPRGHGLWLVNQVCDLVEMRSGPHGTTTRLHMLRPFHDPAGHPAERRPTVPRP